jgi:hypothetical protein
MRIRLDLGLPALPRPGDRRAAAGTLANRISTPNGLSVSALAMRISCLSRDDGIKAEPITPRPPALETAAASGPQAT